MADSGALPLAELPPGKGESTSAAQVAMWHRFLWPQAVRPLKGSNPVHEASTLST